MDRLRWAIIGVALAAAVALIAFLSVGRDHDVATTTDLYAQYTGVPWPCGPAVPEWNAKPEDPNDALNGQWLSDDDIDSVLGTVVPGDSNAWTAQRLEGLRMWVGALRGAFNWVLDTYGPILAERPLMAAEDGERTKTLADSSDRFRRALELTATEIRSGTPADWGDMERPTKRLCDGIYRGR